MGGFDLISSSFTFLGGVSTYVYIDATGLAMATGSSVTLSGANGNIVTQSSVTASAFFGDGSHLTNVTAPGAVQKTGDAMTGSLTMLGASTITIGGTAFSVGSSTLVVTNGNVGIGALQPAAKLHVSSGNLVMDGVGTQAAPSGPGARFEWISSLSALRAGAVSGSQWDTASIGQYSVAFGQSNQASNTYGTISGGFNNSNSGIAGAVAGGANNNDAADYSAISGGNANSISGIYSVIPGGFSNSAAGLYSFAGGAHASAATSGSFVWAGSALGGGPTVTSTVQEQFLARAMGGFNLLSSSFTFSNGVSTYVYVDNTGRVGVGFSTPTAAVDVRNVSGDPEVAVFRDAAGVAIASVTAGGIFAGTQQWSYTLYDPQGIQLGDNIPSIISNRLGTTLTIKEVWCESDDSSARINLTVGGSSMLPSDLTCGSGTATTGFVAGVNEIGVGAKIDHLTQNVTAGAAHRINVVLKYALH
jgi:hypothetical protein